ncbi:hypothetical protein QUF61_11805 [Candidatus Venteria ishoeyi]|uniref:hypothetical protein n=1 Tax=Candidatus Venteria ishoeyi TaxID=1899563 RepID=UPI0025A5DC05|nr:hypothetical protein [Candidatus Venteria ishoeyi]MDM8547170.1 hypothetical protein [Candidatus Venteria ishoeyi]
MNKIEIITVSELYYDEKMAERLCEDFNNSHKDAIKSNHLRPAESSMFLPPKNSNVDGVGFNLVSCMTKVIKIKKSEFAHIGTGIKVNFPPGIFGLILPFFEHYRAFDYSGIGVVKPGDGEIVVHLHNNTKYKQVVSLGQQVAKLIPMPMTSFPIDVIFPSKKTDRVS